MTLRRNKSLMFAKTFFFFFSHMNSLAFVCLTVIVSSKTSGETRNLLCNAAAAGPRPDTFPKKENQVPKWNSPSWTINWSWDEKWSTSGLKNEINFHSWLELYSNFVQVFCEEKNYSKIFKPHSNKQNSRKSFTHLTSKRKEKI